MNNVIDILSNYDIQMDDLAGMNEPDQDQTMSIDQLADRGYLQELGDEVDDDDSIDEPVRGRKDAYDATLDVTDPEDMASGLTKKDIDSSANAAPPINKDIDTQDDDEINTEFDDTEVKLVSSKTRPGTYGLMIKSGGKIVGVEELPERYLELARRKPKLALIKLRAEMSDEELMEEIDKHFNINR